MPLKGYTSLCDAHASVIVSKDRGESQHIGQNIERSYVTHYQIDGVVVTQGSRCDFLLLNEDAKTAYLIELKGSDLTTAAKQLEATERVLARQLAGYDLRYRIVANRCKTQEIETAEFKKYKMKWKKRLAYRSKCLQEVI